MDFKLKAGLIEYDVNFITYGQNGFVTSNCNSITFTNVGTNQVTIDNGLVLQQNQSLSIDGNVGEIINKQFLITFSGTGTNNLVTINKNYL
jgi:hypothetical protein